MIIETSAIVGGDKKARNTLLFPQSLFDPTLRLNDLTLLIGKCLKAISHYPDARDITIKILDSSENTKEDPQNAITFWKGQ